MTEPIDAIKKTMLASLAHRLRPVWIAGAVCQMAFIYWASDRTWEGTASNLPGGVANLVHFPLYGILAGFAFLGARCHEKRSTNCDRWVWLFVAAFGLFDEWHQSNVPGRDFSLWDVVTDGAGAVFATCVLGMVLRGRSAGDLKWPISAFCFALASSFIFPLILPNF